MVTSLASLVSKAAPGLVTAALLSAAMPANVAHAQGYGYGPQPAPAASPAPVVPPPRTPALVQIGRYLIDPYALKYGFKNAGEGWTVVYHGRQVLDLTEGEGQMLLAMQPPRVGRFYVNPYAIARVSRTQDGGWFVSFDDGSPLQLNEDEGRELIRLLTPAPERERPRSGGLMPLPGRPGSPVQAPAAPGPTPDGSFERPFPAPMAPALPGRGEAPAAQPVPPRPAGPVYATPAGVMPPPAEAQYRRPSQQLPASPPATANCAAPVPAATAPGRGL